MAPATTDAARAADRVLRRCDAVAACTESPGEITRRYGTPALTAAMDLVAGWMREAGLATRRDAIGNLIGRFDAAGTGVPPLVLGSHLDSVPNGGRYDGPLGVLLAIEAVQHIARTGVPLPVPVEVVAFADEEGSRFHTTYLGSRAYAGAFDPALLDRTDADGVSLGTACTAFGGDTALLATGVHHSPALFGYLEVHIEQGPALEALDAPLAVVTAIAGQTRVAARIVGEAGHAGTVAMPLRKDALSAAAEIVLAAERRARSTPGLLATVGQLAVAPGASNVVPGEARLTIDVRSPDDDVRASAVAALHDDLATICATRNLAFEWEIVQENPAVPMDAALGDRLAAAVAASGFPVHRLPSGAGHDAVVMAGACPCAMLFVRCAGGVSHHPAEAVSAGDVAAAFTVLTAFLGASADR